MDYKNLIFDVENNIATVKINRPKALNALNTETIKELDEVFTKIEEDDSISVVIITGEGRSFVAGADISEMATKSPAEAKVFAKAGMDVFLKIEKLNKPVIAKINGFALGGGCELLSSCDIRIASDKALFGQPEVGLGITPGFGGTQRLQRLIGPGFAKYLIYTAENIKAQKAYEIGLVQEVVEAEKLDERVKEIAIKIANNAPKAVRFAKEAINTGAQSDIATAMRTEENLFALCFSTEDQKNGMDAFLNKKKAEFKNK
ncbi:MAG: enoyl-CoA hydratase-related protein [Tissierellia bacterium]|nr:enoyl-CoA hydratase-related protein [Tissierellia bacterium]